MTPSNTTSPGTRFTSVPSRILIHPAVWPQYTWAKNWVGALPFFLGGAGSPSNINLPGSRPTSIPSGILVHPAVWPQRTLEKKWVGCARAIASGVLSTPDGWAAPVLRMAVAPPVSTHMDLLALVMSSLLKSIQPLSVALAVQYMVCPSVCLSQVSVLSKRLSVGHAKNAGQKSMCSSFVRQRSCRNSNGSSTTVAPNSTR